MKAFRNPSDRPGLLVDPRAFGLVDPSTENLIGRPGPFGRERVVSALPMEGMNLPPQVVIDPRGFYLSDPDGNLIGEPSLWVPRMLSARWVEDTRRL